MRNIKIVIDKNKYTYSDEYKYEVGVTTNGYSWTYLQALNLQELQSVISSLNEQLKTIKDEESSK